jgi:hypothetical protein
MHARAARIAADRDRGDGAVYFSTPADGRLAAWRAQPRRSADGNSPAPGRDWRFADGVTGIAATDGSACARITLAASR